MILGKTYVQAYTDRQAKLAALKDKRFKKFLLFPRFLMNGQIAWLRFVWMRYNIDRYQYSEALYRRRYNNYYLTESGDE
jgi:hypothetical protein